MKIQSKTDVITNSSSEVFVVRPDKGQSVDELLEDLESVHRKAYREGKDNYSGDVQDIELWGTVKVDKKLWWPKIIMDKGFRGTIDYLKGRYHVHSHSEW